MYPASFFFKKHASAVRLSVSYHLWPQECFSKLLRFFQIFFFQLFFRNSQKLCKLLCVLPYEYAASKLASVPTGLAAAIMHKLLHLFKLHALYHFFQTFTFLDRKNTPLN